MDFQESQLRLPAFVKDTLHSTLCLLLDENTPYLKINEVFVYGQDIFNALKTDSKDDDQWLDNTTWYSRNTVYVLCQHISPDDSYGPFTMMQIFNIPPVPRLPIYRIMDILDNTYSHLGDLDNVSYWKLQDEDLFPKKVFELPQTICQSIKFVTEHFQTELAQCEGILFIPAIILHQGWQHKRIRHIQRDNIDITLMEVDTDVWFLLHTCRPRFYEDEFNPVWFLIHTNHLHTMLL